jgi:hypothetical protein
MARRKAGANSEPTSNPAAADQVPQADQQQTGGGLPETHPDPFEFDPAKLEAAREREPGEDDIPMAEVVSSHAERVGPRRLHGEPKDGVTRAQAQPNPFPENVALLTGSPGGPAMRLFREIERKRVWDGRQQRYVNVEDHLSAIQFPEKPSDEIRQKLRDNGWQWKSEDAVWKKPLGEYPTAEHLAAQKLFEEIANEIRASNGLEPIQGYGAAR